MVTSIIIFIITLLVLVLIHELGHFLMCKRFHIKVLEFGFGLPPKLWSKKYGETEYTINALPIGGFVRPLGEDETDKKILNNPRSFAAQGVGKRIAVVLAGVGMNLIFAWIIFYIVLASQNFETSLQLLDNFHFYGVEQTNQTFIYVLAVEKSSPAKKAGLNIGDRITNIEGKSVTSEQSLVSETKNLAGKEISLTVENTNGVSRQVFLTPRSNPPSGQGPLGVGLGGFKEATLDYKTVPQKILSGPIHSFNIIVYSGKILGQLISQSFSEKSLTPVSKTVAGPVGITSLANSVLTSTSHPFIPYLYFVGLISLNLAIMNLLPIPALDGGRLFFLLIEAVSRRRVNADVERWVHTIGFAALLALTLLITYSDIRKLLS